MERCPVPFNGPWRAGNELTYMTRALDSGHVAGDGPFTRRSQELLDQEFGHRHALLTTSCTDALEMCAILLDIRPGDEILIPSFTFVSTANAFLLYGARLKFVDIEPATMNIDPARIEAQISDRTRAIVVVHYAGISCDMDAVGAVAAAHNLMVIEDNAHGLGGSYRDRALGSFGVLATLSFHETKNFTCGEGGALVVNDPSYLERAEIIREKGTNRSQFMRGELAKYEWVDTGSSFLLSDVLAAYLAAQLEAKTRIETLRKAIWCRYLDELAGWATSAGVALPRVPPECRPAHHMFQMLMPSRAARDDLIGALAAQRIQATFHYVPLHLSPMGRRLGYAPGDLAVTEDVSDRLVRLPFFTGLGADDQQRVISAVTATGGG